MYEIKITEGWKICINNKKEIFFSMETCLQYLEITNEEFNEILIRLKDVLNPFEEYENEKYIYEDDVKIIGTQPEIAKKARDKFLLYIKRIIKKERENKGNINITDENRTYYIVEALFDLVKKEKENSERLFDLKKEFDSIKERKITQQTRKIIRDGVTWVAKTYYTEAEYNTIWSELRDIAVFNHLNEITEIQGKQLLEFLRKKYEYKYGYYQDLKSFENDGK